MYIVTGQRFHNRTLDLDGNDYRDCHFVNCEFRFLGITPLGFSHYLIEGTFWLHRHGGWYQSLQLLGPLREEITRYGYRLENAVIAHSDHWAGEDFHGE